eukprot:Seg135.5 transcript_id=Seg135.5/GoldUCD/mRNA.D3Y31 product="hypothetical protein" pseudo=true protein_id=Seg135.5/GoldUCD/D3Y31
MTGNKNSSVYCLTATMGDTLVVSAYFGQGKQILRKINSPLGFKELMNRTDFAVTAQNSPTGQVSANYSLRINGMGSFIFMVTSNKSSR